MLRKSLFLILLLILLMNRFSIVQAQNIPNPKNNTDYIVTIDLINKIVKPPFNCIEASSIAILDTTSGKFTFINEIISQEEILKQLQTDIFNKMEAIKSVKNNAGKQGPPGSFGPPGGNAPPNGGMPEEFLKIKQLINKSRDASDSISNEVERFKSEIKKSQDELNKNLKLTKSEDKDSRVLLVNDFLKGIRLNYDNYFSDITKNIKIINTAFKNIELNIDKEDGFIFPPMEIGILKTEDNLVYTSLFLLNITKECAKIGSGFYAEGK